MENLTAEQILEGNNNMETIKTGNLGGDPRHLKYLEHGKDAFGNIIAPEEGYRLVEPNEQIEMGDRHFDIYGGWTSGGEGYYARNGYRARGMGRWRCWSRKI